MTEIKNKILQAIEESSKEINEENLNTYQKRVVSLIGMILSTNPCKIFHTIKDNNTRCVIIGDIHCDFNSMKEILKKILISEYDYYGKGYLIFLGDYIDRGQLPLQVILLLMKLKLLLGERCIILKGNHDNIEFKDEKFYSKVHPAETIDLLNQHFNINTINKLKLFFDSLPYFIILQKRKKKFFIVHGGITPDKYMDGLRIKKLSKLNIPIPSDSEENKYEKDVLESLLWGDPVNSKFKQNNNSIRFEFGYEQFEKFMIKNKLTHLIRGHEPVTNGFKSLYDNKIFTIFSTGGLSNENSYYTDSVPYPAIVVIDEEGNLFPEHIFVQKINLFIHSSNSVRNEDTYNYIIEKKDYFPYSYIVKTNIKLDNVVTENSSVLKVYEGKHYVNDEFALTLELPLGTKDSIKKTIIF